MTTKNYPLPDDIIKRIDAWLANHKKKRKPTINDVAQVSKLSKKTISRVLNKSSLVKPATQEKVEAIIDRIGFIPDPQARGLAFKHSFLIGLVYDNPNPQYVVNMQAGILKALEETEFELVIHQIDRNKPNAIEDTVRFVEKQKLFGVVLTPPVSENDALANALRDSGSAYVRIAGVPLDDKQHMITSNDRIGGFQATNHLVELGHKDIAYITGVREFRSSEERLKGMKDSLKEAGLSLPAKFIFEGGYTFESGIAAAERLLSLKKRPTAVFAANDHMAAGVIHAARVRGYSVPDDLSVVGFDDFNLAIMTWPRITTIHSPVAELGQLAVSNLFALQDLHAPLSTHETEPWLVVRESTAAPSS